MVVKIENTQAQLYQVAEIKKNYRSIQEAAWKMYFGTTKKFIFDLFFFICPLNPIDVYPYNFKLQILFNWVCFLVFNNKIPNTFIFIGYLKFG